MSQSITGAHQVFAYIWEDELEYNQDPGEPTDDDFKPFGSAETFDTQDRENNPERMYRPFNRGADEIIETAWNGSWGVDFVVTNSWWLQFMYGTPDVVEVDPDVEWEHTYAFDPRAPPLSAHLIEETHYPDGEIEQNVYTGAVASGADADVAVEDTIGISLTGNYGFERTFSTAEEDTLPYGDPEEGINEQPVTEYRPMHFGNAFFLLDLDNDGTPEDKRLVQDVSLSLEGNVELEAEIGTRFPVIPSYLNFEFDVSYTNLLSVDIRTDEKFSSYGSGAATVQEPQETMHDSDIIGELQFDAGVPDEINAWVFELEEAFPDSFSRANVGDPEAAIEESIDRMLTNADVVVSTDVAEPR